MQEQIPAIRTEALCKSYSSNSALALDLLDMTVRQGEIFGFLGPNGAGKTTTIKLLVDLIRPTSGRALILGLDCRKDSLEVRKKVGYLPGDFRLYPNFNGQQLIKLFASIRPKQVVKEYVMNLCKKLDLDLDTPSRRLSHGNRQKIGLVLAMMPQPDVLILDEPTTGLDPLVQHQVLDCLQDARSAGRTVFFSSHILNEVEQICDRVGIIRQGKLVAIEEIQTLKQHRLQRIRFNFAEPIQLLAFSSLPGVRVIESTTQSVYLEVTGESDSVVKAAARYHVLSLESDHPSLEDAFMAYYKARPSCTN